MHRPLTMTIRGPISGCSMYVIMYRVAQKASHCQESSLNRIKTRSAATFLISFEYKMNTRMLEVCVKYSMCDLICDVIGCCVWSCDVGKNQCIWQNHDWKPEKRRNMEIKEFLHKSLSNRWYTNGIHSLLNRADARESADIIYRMWRLSLLCRSGIVIDTKM